MQTRPDAQFEGIFKGENSKISRVFRFFLRPVKQQHSTKYGLKAVTCGFLHSEQNQLDASDANTISKYHSKSILRKYEATVETKAFINRLLETTDGSFSSSALKLGLDSVAFSVMRTLAQLLSICRRACPRFAAALFNPHPNSVRIFASALIIVLSATRLSKRPITYTEACKRLERPRGVSIIPNGNTSRHFPPLVPWS